MNPSTSNTKGLLIKTAIAFIIMVLIAAIVYMYFSVFVLNKNEPYVKTQQELDQERWRSEMLAPPRQDIQLTDTRKEEVEDDLRAKPASGAVNTQSQIQASSELKQ